MQRPREVLGTLRTVLFAPEDLALVKGDPSERRRFLDELLVARQPRWAGVRSDYDKVLRQRNALLKSAAPVLRRGARYRPRPAEEAGDDARASALHTLDIWNDHLATVGSQLLYARLRLLRDLGPYLSKAYDEVSAGQSDARVSYKSSLREEVAASIAAGEVPEAEELRAQILAALEEARPREVERGVSLVGPHRDDVVLTLGELPAKGYASHGESWSFALGLKLAAYQLLRHDLGEDPVLILDDVFAELDSGRRERLAAMIADCEQVLITAAVDEDVPSSLAGQEYVVRLGEVAPRE
jgi:DNA replication and repair protein RecF